MVVKNGDSPWFVSVKKKSTNKKNPRYWRVFHLTFIHGLSRLKRKQLQSLAMSNVCYFFVANLKDRKDPPMVSGEWTCRVRRGVLVLKMTPVLRVQWTLGKWINSRFPKVQVVHPSSKLLFSASLYHIYFSYVFFRDSGCSCGLFLPFLD